MKIVHVSESVFQELWEKLQAQDRLRYPVLTFTDIEYSKEYAGGHPFEDVSLLVEEDETPLLGLCMAVRRYPNADCELSGFGRPILYLEASGIEPGRSERAGAMVRAELGRIMQKYPLTIILHQELQSPLSVAGRFFLESGAQATPLFTQVIDLSLSEANLRNQVRKSYKNLINWGLKNLRLTLLDHASITADAIAQFRALHIEVAGRETRSRRTWELQLKMVFQKEAFVILGHMNDALVTAALFVHSPAYCVYGVSASRRELFDKPISHCVVWTAILHAKKLGCRWFEMGELLFAGQGSIAPASKEIGISTFKRGFGGETWLRLNIVWKKGVPGLHEQGAVSSGNENDFIV